MFDGVRKAITCPACGGYKMAGALFCGVCFPKYHAGKGHYTPDGHRLAAAKEAEIADDPWDAVFDEEFERMERDLGIKW